MNSPTQSPELPQVYIADSLLENCFDTLALNEQKLGTYLAGQNFPEGAIEETTISFFAGLPNEEKDTLGCALGTAILLYPEACVIAAVERTFNSEQSIDVTTVHSVASEVLDKVTKHEFSHRYDEAKPAVKREVDADDQLTEALLKTKVRRIATQFAVHELVLLDAIELFAKANALPVGVAPGSLALGSLGVVLGLHRRLSGVRSDILGQRYKEAPHEKRAYEVQEQGMTGFFDIAIKPEFIDGVVEKLQPRRRFW